MVSHMDSFVAGHARSSIPLNPYDAVTYHGV